MSYEATVEILGAEVRRLQAKLQAITDDYTALMARNDELTTQLLRATVAESKAREELYRATPKETPCD